MRENIESKINITKRKENETPKKNFKFHDTDYYKGVINYVKEFKQFRNELNETIEKIDEERKERGIFPLDNNANKEIQ